jgi:hypothetical protein
MHLAGRGGGEGEQTESAVAQTAAWPDRPFAKLAREWARAHWTALERITQRLRELLIGEASSSSG